MAESYEVKEARLLSDWIATNRRSKEWQLINVKSVIVHVVNERFEGYWTKMASGMNTAKVTFHGWISGKHNPNLWHLLRLADFLNITLDALCRGDISGLGPAVGKSPDQRKPKKRANNNWPLIKLKLEECLVTYPPPSLSQICRSIGIDVRGVRKLQPVLAKKIVARHSEYCRKQQAERRDAVLTAAVAIVQREGTFTIKGLRKELKKLGFAPSWYEHSEMCRKLQQQMKS